MKRRTQTDGESPRFHPKTASQCEIGKNLKVLRNSAGLSQAKLAEKLGMDRSYYSLFESGRRIPDIDLLYSVAKLFGVSVELLIEADPEKLIGQAVYYCVYGRDDRRFLALFHSLTPFSKGRLLERAEMLAEWDAFRAERLKNLKSEK